MPGAWHPVPRRPFGVDAREPGVTGESGDGQPHATVNVTYTLEASTLSDVFKQNESTTNYLVHWSKRYRYVYVETPKVACTTVKRVLQLAESDGARRFERPGDVHDRSQSPLLAPRTDMPAFIAAMSAGDCFRFCFVRNPFTRVLSCYLDKMVENAYERRRLAPKLGFDPQTPPAFDAFLQAVADQPDQERDIHWASQTYLLRPQRVRYSFIGRFELFEPQFGMVCQHLGVAAYAADLKGTAHATNAYEKVKDYYSQREIDLVAKIYDPDFRNFGYGWSPVVI
jgi:hypothetical protein